MTRLSASTWVILTTLLSTAVAADDEIPAPFVRFEAMVGGWKGTARPAVNRVRGWPESHAWAWKFSNGTPVGMTVSVEGGKVFTKGSLAFDGAKKTYTLAATDLQGTPITFVGKATPDGKGLILDRVGEVAEGKERLTIRPNASGIRYTMLLDRQARGAPQYKNAIEVGLTKEGEAFAASSAESNGPKCILTGGNATMSVSHNGKSYPVCCTGCRDEFNENPEKYVARAEARAKAGGDKTPASTAKPTPSPRSGGEFDGLVDAPRSKAMTPPRARTDASSTPSPRTDADAARESKAARGYRLGQAYEKGGKTEAALKSYGGVVKDYPGTPSAEAAAARIQALEKR